MKPCQFKQLLFSLGLAGSFFVNGVGWASGTVLDKDMVERGRYIAKIAGCNDCHTPNYLHSEGNVPMQLWLSGDTFGWRGPWDI